jgi:lysophospholipase L1-like esterase
MFMFDAKCWALATGIVLAGGMAMTAGDDDSRPNPAAIPVNRDNARHQQLLKLVAKGGGDVVFLGDSITERWESTGAKVWKEAFAPLKAVNLGVGGDQTGHVLWRIREGKELEPLTPRVAVVLIGINNPVAHRPEQVAGGVQAIVEELKKQKPHIKVLVLGIFPCSLKRQDKAVQRIGAADLQPRVKQINAALAKLHDGKSVFFKDIGSRFLEEDGGLSQQVMSDFLHLGPRGYQIWADAINDDVQKLLR